jgi:nicotinamide mononucleotide transporter
MTLRDLWALLDWRLLDLGGAVLTLGEAVGFVTGVLCVWLLARQSLWNWPLALANVLLYALIFLRAGLYADATLQVVFAALNSYGWWSWRRGGAGDRPGARRELPVRRTPPAVWVWLAAAAALSTAGVYFLLAAATDSTVPFWDASTTALSLAAIYGQARKYLESWLLWIAADLVYIPLYLYKDLWLTAVLYAVYLTLCVFGWRAWRSQAMVVATP